MDDKSFYKVFEKTFSPLEQIALNMGFKIWKKNLDNCPFCHLSEDVKVICDSDDCVAFYDRFPVSKGHALIVPKRHVANYFDLTKSEIASMQQMLAKSQGNIGQLSSTLTDII
jgi:ATP adenylyltransferase/5',5'''-P-1,P-4-tetraphosphate phosphorylase II